MERLDEIISLIDSQKKENTKNLLFKYLKQWPWFLVFSIIGIFLGYFVFKNSPNTYKVSSRILVKSEENKLSSVFSSDNSRDIGKNSNIENHIGILKSYTLYRKALEKLNWDFTWYKKNSFYNSDLYTNEPFELIIPANAKNAKNILLEIKMLNDSEFNIQAEGETFQNGYDQLLDINKSVKFGEPFSNEFFNFIINKGNGEIGQTYLLCFNNLNSVTSEYLAKTNIYAESDNSDLITVMIEGEIRQREADFINELNKVFIEFGMENQFKNTESSMEFIDSQLERIKASLGTAEENYSSYRKNNQVMNLGQEAQTVFASLQQIEQEQYLTQLQIDYYRDLQQYLDDSKKIEQMVSPSVIGITDPNLNVMLSKLMDLYSRREVLSYSVQDKNPALIVIEKEIKIARDGLEETLKNQLKATESKLESNKERYNNIQNRLKKLPETEKKLIGIQREFDLNNELYTYMLQKKAEASISKASIAPEVQVIDAALAEAAVRTGPNLILDIAIGMVAGGIIPFIFITLLSIFTNKIETVDEVEDASKIPVFEGIVRHKYKVKLPVIHYPRSGIAECFRGVKSNINALLDSSGSKVISINSLIPNEGKSFISSNLAAIFSRTDKKVLLIGADLHKPTLHDFMDVKESFGLSNYLNNEKSIEDAISATSYPNLYLMQAGSAGENTYDLMDSLKFEKLIEHLRSKYDYIFIDNAPLMLVPDAVLTSQFSDISLFILRINFSNKAQIKQINKIVNFNKIETAAIVINDITVNSYGYGYGDRKKYWKKGYGEYKSSLRIV